MDLTFRSLQRWPKQATPAHRRQRSPFHSKYADTLSLLERELGHLRARTVVIEADCEASEIRRDGNLRADARLKGPGIVLRFESKHGPQTFPCDTFTEWQDNLRAIALALEALRKVDRYGVTNSGEQYCGFAALPDKSQSNTFPDAHTAAAWIAGQIHEAVPPLPWGEVEKDWARRKAIPCCHPDRCAGDDSAWKLWQDAATLLGIEV